MRGAGPLGRRSIRRKDFAYEQPGFYFVTVCTQRKRCLFGRVEREEVVLSPAGRMVRQWIARVLERYPSVAIDCSVIMPNHLHLLIELHDSFDADPDRIPLWRVVQWLKAGTTLDYIDQVRAGRWPPFDRRLWQRNYWERIVRSQEELSQTRDYIHANPSRWSRDRFNTLNRRAP